MESENISNLTDRFFGGYVPRTLETTYVCSALGAPIQYSNDKITGQTSGCMMVPYKQGGKTNYQPFVVTYGNEDSVGTMLYQGLYHQIDVDFLLDSKQSDDEIVKKLCEKFQKLFNLGTGNNYLNMFDARIKELENTVVKPLYPENYEQFLKVVDLYKGELSVMYSTTRANTNAVSAAEPVSAEEKKTINAKMEAQISAEAN